MRAVIYAMDMEPITVVELSEFAVRHLGLHGVVRLAVNIPLAYDYDGQKLTLSAPYEHLIVNLVAERITMGRITHMMLFTRDEEAALLLESAFLPGQHRAVNELRAKAFAQGFMKAISEMGR